jgi:DNA polymerase III epsilon subunit-like protein
MPATSGYVQVIQGAVGGGPPIPTTDANPPRIRHVFLDLETTGLDPDRDVITQMAWIYEQKRDGEVIQVVERNYHVDYDGFPTLWAARNTNARRERRNGYGGADYLAGPSTCRLACALDVFFEDCLALSDNGKTPVYLVGAVPTFDHQFLRKVYREVPYHYHVIDIEAMFMGAMGAFVPPTLSEIASITGIKNADAHDALADARHVYQIWKWLEGAKAR